MSMIVHTTQNRRALKCHCHAPEGVESVTAHSVNNMASSMRNAGSIHEANVVNPFGTADGMPEKNRTFDRSSDWHMIPAPARPVLVAITYWANFEVAPTITRFLRHTTICRIANMTANTVPANT